jgi:hypothetical protein
VVLKRLEAAGLAERVDKRRYALSPGLTKGAMKAARKGRKPKPS